MLLPAKLTWFRSISSQDQSVGGGFKTVLAVTPNLKYPGRGPQKLISSLATNKGDTGLPLCLGFHFTVCGGNHEPLCSQLGEDIFDGLTVKVEPVVTYFVTFNGRWIYSVIDSL